MLASSSRNVLKSAPQKICRAVAGAKSVSFAVVSCRHEQRRHASNAYGSVYRRQSGSRLRVNPYQHPPDVKFHPQHSPVSQYNLQLGDCIDRKKTVTAMKLARTMKEEGVLPNRTTYTNLLRACALEGMHDEARAVYQDMLAMGIQPDRQTFHKLIEAATGEQSEMFDILKLMEQWSIRPNEVTYEIIITRFAEGGRLELALQYLSQLSPAGLSPTLNTAKAVIRCAIRIGFSRLALDLADAFESTSIRRLEPDVWVDMLVGCAADLYAEGTQRTWNKVVNELNILPDEGCCLQVLHTAGRHGLPDLALQVIETLKKINIVWCEHHIAPVIEAMCHGEELREAFMMFDFMRKNDIAPSLTTAQPIFERISKDTDSVDEAWTMLENIHEDGQIVDIVAFNAVVKAAVAVNDLQRAVGTYKSASQIGVKPDLETFNLLFQACVDARHRELGNQLLLDMKEANIRPDKTTYEYMVRLCLTQSTYEDAFFYLEEMKSQQIVPPFSVYDAIIRKLISVGDTRWKLALEELKECGHEVPERLAAFISSGGLINGSSKVPRVDMMVL